MRRGARERERSFYTQLYCTLESGEILHSQSWTVTHSRLWGPCTSTLFLAVCIRLASLQDENVIRLTLYFLPTLRVPHLVFLHRMVWWTKMPHDRTFWSLPLTVMDRNKSQQWNHLFMWRSVKSSDADSSVHTPQGWCQHCCSLILCLA